MLSLGLIWPSSPATYSAADVACDRACSMSCHDFARHRKQNRRNQTIYTKEHMLAHGSVSILVKHLSDVGSSQVTRDWYESRIKGVEVEQAALNAPPSTRSQAPSTQSPARESATSSSSTKQLQHRRLPTEWLKIASAATMKWRSIRLQEAPLVWRWP
jgi:hypothetical protein